MGFVSLLPPVLPAPVRIWRLIRHGDLALLVGFALVGCAPSGYLPGNTGYYAYSPAREPACENLSGGESATRQCYRYYAREKITSYCPTLGGSTAVWQCQQYYAKEAGLSEAVSGPPSSAPIV